MLVHKNKDLPLMVSTAIPASFKVLSILAETSLTIPLSPSNVRLPPGTYFLVVDGGGACGLTITDTVHILRTFLYPAYAYTRYTIGLSSDNTITLTNNHLSTSVWCIKVNARIVDIHKSF